TPNTRVKGLADSKSPPPETSSPWRTLTAIRHAELVVRPGPDLVRNAISRHRGILRGLAPAVSTPPVPLLPQEDHPVLVVHDPLRDANLPVVPPFHAFEGAPVVLALRTVERDVWEAFETRGVGHGGTRDVPRAGLGSSCLQVGVSVRTPGQTCGS
ncbi:unnamed protein product, partial [Ectocarpus sp. 12 AP-2014]